LLFNQNLVVVLVIVCIRDTRKGGLQVDLVLAKHPVLTTSYEVNQICKPFFIRTNVNAFRFERRFFDGYRFTLSSHHQWIEYYYRQKLFRFDRREHIKRQNCINCAILWDTWEKKNASYRKIELAAERDFQLGRGLTLFRVADAWVDMFSFTSDPYNWGINAFYVQHLDLFEQFLLSFQDQAKHLIALATATRFQVNMPQQKKTNDSDVFPEYVRGGNKQASQNPLYYSLTDAEKSCLDCLVAGKTAKEVAMIMACSSRTTEKHIASIKKKFNVSTLLQLGYQLNQQWSKHA